MIKGRQRYVLINPIGLFVMEEPDDWNVKKTVIKYTSSIWKAKRFRSADEASSYARTYQIGAVAPQLMESATPKGIFGGILA